MKEAPGSSETSVLTGATRRNNPEDTILQVKLSILVRDLYVPSMEHNNIRNYAKSQRNNLAYNLSFRIGEYLVIRYVMERTSVRAVGQDNFRLSLSIDFILFDVLTLGNNLCSSDQ
jgi:hypothetical protein